MLDVRNGNIAEDGMSGRLIASGPPGPTPGPPPGPKPTPPPGPSQLGPTKRKPKSKTG